MKQIALVLLSNRQESITCLGVAMSKHSDTQAIGFSYPGQEIDQMENVRELANQLDIKYHLVPLGLHPIFIRSSLLLNIAHKMANQITANTIYSGVCAADSSRYSDCTDEFIKSHQVSLNLGYDTRIRIETPLITLDNASIWEVAESIGWLDTIIKVSHNCENYIHDKLHEWGYGCGTCEACKIRKQGFHIFMRRG